MSRRSETKGVWILALAWLVAGCATEQGAAPAAPVTLHLAMATSGPLESGSSRVEAARRLIGCDDCRLLAWADVTGRERTFVVAAAPHVRLRPSDDLRHAVVREEPHLRSGEGTWFAVELVLSEAAPEALRRTRDLVPLALTTRIGSAPVGIAPVFENTASRVRVARFADRAEAVAIAARLGEVVFDSPSREELERRREARLDLLAAVYGSALCADGSGGTRAIEAELEALLQWLPELSEWIDCGGAP